MIHPGDEAIVLEPCYDSYVPAIELSGGVRVVPLRYPDYSIDWRAVGAAVTPKTRLRSSIRPTIPPAPCPGADDIRELMSW